MVRLGTDTQRGVLQLDEVAHVCGVGKVCPGPKSRVGTDHAVAADLGLGKHAVRMHFGVVSNLDIAEHAASADTYAVA